jgi:hypothetical protein
MEPQAGKWASEVLDRTLRTPQNEPFEFATQRGKVFETSHIGTHFKKSKA